MPLSDSKIRNLKPKDKSFKVSDFEGLYILVKPNGSKLWNFKYRLHGAEKKLSIGSYPDVSLAQARKIKSEARAQVAVGIDPSEAKQEAKALAREAHGNRFEKIGAAFLSKQQIEGKSKATLDKTAYHLKLANTAFGCKPITKITYLLNFEACCAIQNRDRDRNGSRRPVVRCEERHSVFFIMMRAQEPRQSNPPWMRVSSQRFDKRCVSPSLGADVGRTRWSKWKSR